MKISMDMSKGAYEVGKRVYEGRITRNEGKSEINRLTGMNLGSAQAFLTIFLSMMDGVKYKRAFNNDTNKYLFENIYKDFGEKYLENALKAAQQHVDYYATLDKGQLIGLQRIIDECEEKYGIE